MFQLDDDLNDFFESIPLSNLDENKLKNSFSDIKVTKTYDIEGTDSGSFVFENISLSDDIYMIEHIDNQGNSNIKCKTRMSQDALTKNPENNTVYFKYKVSDLNIIDGIISLDEGTFTLTHDETVTNLSDLMDKLSFLGINESSLSSSSSGSFMVDVKNYTNLNFYMFIMLYPIWKKKKFLDNVIFLKETTSPRGSKPGLKFYFKDLEGSQFDHWFSFNIERYIGTKYIVNYNTKNKNTEFMIQCSILLQKYMTYFGKKYIPAVDSIEGFYGEEYYNYVPENIGMTVNKLSNLRQKTKPRNLFPSKGFYSKKMCECKLQPIIIEQEDFSEWNDYNSKGIISFPPNETDGKYFVCPSEAKFATLKPNKGINQKEYPYLPCCRKTEDQNLKNIINKYAKIKSDGKGPIIDVKESEIKSIKIPLDLDVYLNKKYKLIPQFVNVENSLIACLFQAKYNKIMKDKEINEYRRTMTNNGISINTVKQECFDMDDEEIVKTLKETNIIDSRLYFRFFEYLFKVNIFVFIDEGDRVYLETPRYKNFHVRNPIKENKLVLLLRDSNYRYSLLQSSEKDTSFYEKITPYYSFDKSLNIKRENKYKETVWEKILNGHSLKSQKIDENGKCYAINTMFNDELVTIYIPPSYPLNLPLSIDTYFASKENVFKIMGKGEEGYNGIWYNINRVKEVFIPCSNIKKEGYRCKQFIIDENKIVEQEYNLHKLKKNNAMKLAQMMMWLLELSESSVNNFYSRYVNIKETNLFSTEELNIQKTNLKYDVTSAIQYLKNFNKKFETVFNFDKISLPKKVYDNMFLYLKHNKKYIDKKKYIEMLENKNKTVKTESVSLIDPVKKELVLDYKIFTSRDEFYKWNEDMNDITILNNLTKESDKYIYIKDNIFYIIMIFNNKDEAIYVSEYWKSNQRIPRKIKRQSSSDYTYVSYKDNFDYHENLIIDFDLKYGTYIKLI